MRTYACIIGKSLFKMDLTLKLPKPGHAKTFSTTTVPPNIVGIPIQKIEMATCNEFLKI